MKKKKVSKRMTAAVISCALILSLTACGSNKGNINENQDPLTGEDMSETGDTAQDMGDGMQSDADYDDFDTLINDENTAPNSIIDYINTNIVSAGVADVERFFKGLLGFGDDIRNIDFTGLEDSRQYMPEDMIAFMDLMKLEADTPSMAISDEENRKVINMTLSEMLERALLFEQHLKKYPDNVTTEAAARLYEEIATNAISGGYDSTEGIAHYYKGETDDVVDREALQYYQQFAEANSDSNLGKIVNEYITLLESNQFQINDELEDFYRGLYVRLDVDKWAADSNNAGGAIAESDSISSTVSDENGSGSVGNEAGVNDVSNSAGGASDTVIEGIKTR